MTISRATSRLTGIVPPMVTPLLDRDELDQPGLIRLVEHILAGGVSGLFVLGTTGEGPSLDYQTRYRLVEETCNLVAGRVPVLVGVTDSSFGESVQLSEFAGGCGAAGVVAAPPYYFPMSQTDLTRYFLELADASPLPVYLYNMPVCTKTAIEFRTVEGCLKHPNIAGVKDSCGDIAQFQRLLEFRSVRSDWTFLIGPEHLTAEAVLLGGDGGVNGGANLLPRLFTDIYDAALKKDTSRVAELQKQVMELGTLYDVGGDFVSVARSLKCALSLLGICEDRMADPFQTYGAAQRSEVERRLMQLGVARNEVGSREAGGGGLKAD